MAKDLYSIAKKKGIKYFLISFVDFFGVMRSKLVPYQAIKDMQKNGAGFGGFSTWLDMTPADPDMFALPDPDSLTILPWKKEVAWLTSDLYMNGKPVKASPRVILRNQIKEYVVDLALKRVTLQLEGKLSSSVQQKIIDRNVMWNTIFICALWTLGILYRPSIGITTLFILVGTIKRNRPTWQLF